MIPKIIHYCWFGRGPMPEDNLKCIESWKKFLPDYKLMLWNEDNYDVNSIKFTRQAKKRNMRSSSTRSGCSYCGSTAASGWIPISKSSKTSIRCWNCPPS